MPKTDLESDREWATRCVGSNKGLEDRSDLRLWCNDLSSPEDVPVEVAS